MVVTVGTAGHLTLASSEELTTPTRASFCVQCAAILTCFPRTRFSFTFFSGVRVWAATLTGLEVHRPAVLANLVTTFVLTNPTDIGTCTQETA